MVRQRGPDAGGLVDLGSASAAAGVLGGRRRSLPTGRAVVGGFLVALAAVVVLAAVLSGSGNHRHPYVVAAQTLGPGTVLSPGDLDTAPMQLPAGSRKLAYTQVSSLIGRTLAVAVQPGELIQASMLGPTRTEPSLRPVSVPADPDSLGNLSDGQKVDVLASTGTGTSAAVSVVMRGAVLLDIGHSSSGVLSGPTTSIVVTLGVSTLSEVESIVQAAQAGTVTLVAAEPSDGTGPGSGP